MSEKKPEAAPPADKAADKAAAPAAAGGGGIKALLPAILAIVLAPAITWAVAQFVLLPKFRASLAEAVADPSAAGKPAKAEKAEKSEKSEKPAGHGKSEKAGEGGGEGYHFTNIVVNLSGTMGTRYLKASFLVTSENPNLTARFDAAKPQLGDVTLAVLSSLTLADLEESGSKNIIRERLLAAYNQALGEKLAENLYFSEFVVQ
jgi:flagellar protein FliL